MKAKSVLNNGIEVTKDHIVSDLREIGLREGDHVAATLSFKSLGYVKGGAEEFIDSLLEVVGTNGTIMMNAFTRPPKREDIPVSEIMDSNYVFNYQETPTWTGLVPETLRRRKDAIRSRNPVCSVVAIGRLARHLTEDHDENSDLYAPYSKLAELDGKYLCIGLKDNPLVAIRHEAQRLAGLFDVVYRPHAVKYRDNEGNIRIYVYNMPPCARKLPELVPALLEMGVLKSGRIGFADSMISPAKDLLYAMANMLKEDPTLNLCDVTYCLWCRECERKKGLYKRIKNPKYFQRNRLVIKTIALINDVRLRKYKVSCLPENMKQL